MDPPVSEYGGAVPADAKFELKDGEQGLICAFALGPPVPIDAAALADDAPDVPPRWLHFNLADTRARRWIERQSTVHADAREILVEPTSRVQGQIVRGSLVLVLADLHQDLRGGTEQVGTLAIYVDQRMIVTGRRHPLRSADRLRRKLPQGMTTASSAELLEELLELLMDTFGELVARLSDDVDDAEDKILTGHLHEQGARLGRMRRLLARLRRHARSNRSALAAVLPRLPAWFDDERRQHLHEVAERMEALAQDIELVQERTRLLQEEIEGRLNEATNRNLFFLSVITATMLPVNIITGIFGMNVGGLPWLGDATGFHWVTGIMVVAVVAVLLILRRRRIF
jgi:zinc transporter